jgi:hypothetical protein
MTSEQAITQTLKQIKKLYEQVSKESGTEGTISEIRASKIIMPVHEYIKAELISKGINPHKMFPSLGSKKPEIKLKGYLKCKDQDILVLPVKPTKEQIKKTKSLEILAEENKTRLLSINVRSQLSSLGKNYDTLFERTFAEALNLHLENRLLVLGEVYLVPLVAYDPDARGTETPKFKEVLPALKYIRSFQQINSRNSNGEGDEYKYERVCLLIVDFRKDPPRVINTVSELVKEGIVSEEEAKQISLQNLTLFDFVDDLLNIYERRHGSLKDLKS